MRAKAAIASSLTGLIGSTLALAAPGAPPAGYQLSNVSTGIGSTSLTYISQMVFKPGDTAHLYATRAYANVVTRYDYNAVTGQLSNPFNVVNLAGVADGMNVAMGIGFHGNDLWLTRWSDSSRAEALSRLRDGNGDGVYETRADFVTGMTSGMHEINQIQIVGDSLFTSIGTTTNTGDPTKEQVYNGTIDRVGDLNNIATMDLSTAGDRTTFQQSNISDGKFRRYAGGMRNPYGIRVTSGGVVWAADNGQDTTTGVIASPDWLYRDLHAGDFGRFPVAGSPGAPASPVTPFANLGLRVGSSGFDFIPSGPNRGDPLVAFSSGSAGGQRLARVDLMSGAVSDFTTGFNLLTDVVPDPFGRLLTSDFLANAVYLLTPPRDADSNLDGKVDINDLYALASHWHMSASWSNGDFDRSGFVDAADLGLLAHNWQGGAALSEALTSLGLPQTPVPEPRTSTAAILAVASASLRRKFVLRTRRAWVW